MTESLTQLIKCDLFKDLYVILYMQENHSKDQVLQALIHKIEGMDETRQLRILPAIMYIELNPDTFTKIIHLRCSSSSCASCAKTTLLDI